eukprot:COSAG02_NODE_55719_length_289_cov_0.668421_1_plen_36_part_10
MMMTMMMHRLNLSWGHNIAAVTGSPGAADDPGLQLH